MHRSNAACKLVMCLQAACLRLRARLGNEQHRHHHQGQTDEVNPHPAYGFYGLTSKQTRHRCGAEHQKVVHALYLAFFLWAVGKADQLGRADKSEIPTHAEQ